MLLRALPQPLLSRQGSQLHWVMAAHPAEGTIQINLLTQVAAAVEAEQQTKMLSRLGWTLSDVDNHDITRHILTSKLNYDVY